MTEQELTDALNAIPHQSLEALIQTYEGYLKDHAVSAAMSTKTGNALDVAKELGWVECLNAVVVELEKLLNRPAS